MNDWLKLTKATHVTAALEIEVTRGTLPLVSGGSSQEGGERLLILPQGAVQTKAVGHGVLLTCKPDVVDNSLITGQVWRRPDGSVIPNVMDSTQRPPMYTEWLPGEKVLALIIPNLKETDAGNYSCTAKYANTQDLTNHVNIETIEAITWLDAPLDQHPVINTHYTVRCKVKARPGPIVNWLRDGDILLLESNTHYVPSPEGLLIKNITEADEGIYTCRAIVTSTGELSERAINVVVHTPPTIRENMVTTVSAVVGQDATLTCQALGKPSPRYNWVQLPTQRDLSSAGRFSVDALKGILTISPVEKDDQGEYNCIASNEAGQKTKKVQLDVMVPPHIDPITNLSTPMGENVKLECVARGRPPPVITFRKLSSDVEFKQGAQPSDVRITVDNKWDQKMEAMVGSILIDGVIRSDDGLYECLASNQGGEARRNGHVMVEFKPSFANTPMTEAWTWPQHPVNITCLAESIPNATIIWTVNGKNISEDSRFIQYHNGPESSILINPSGQSYYGDYKCIARNKHGNAEHTIHVKEGSVPLPVLQAKMDVITATTITFSFIGPADFAGIRTKAYAVQYKEDRQSWDEARNKTWVVDTPYILENLTPQTHYNFRFAAQNEVGFGPWGSESERLMPKRSPPEEPRILNTVLPEGVSVSPYATYFELRWQIPADNGEKIDLYEIKYCIVTRSGNQWQQQPNTCQDQSKRADNQPTSFTLQHLTPDTHYKVELRAHNNIGYSSPGQIIMKTVADRTPGEPPVPGPAPVLSSAAIVIIVVASLFVLLIIIDLLCFCLNKSGIIMAICEMTRSKPDDTDMKLGSIKDLSHTGGAVFVAEKLPAKVPIEEKEPLKDENRQLAPIIRSVKRETSVDFDMKKSISRTSFVGKDSAV